MSRRTLKGIPPNKCTQCGRTFKTHGSGGICDTCSGAVRGRKGRRKDKR